MGVLRAIEILLDVSLALVEDVVNTTLNPGGSSISPGIVTVTPGSMRGIYPNAILVADYANPSPLTEEAVTVTSTTATTFTATFANSHSNTASLVAATFPSGQAIGDPLFTQSEMLSYLSESQSDFGLKVQPVYNTATQGLTAGKLIYPAPADSIRVERISVINQGATPPTAVELWDETATGLDWMVPNWPATVGTNIPKYWYQDKTGVQNFGVGPPPGVGQTATIYYSQLGNTSLGMLSGFLLPDVMACFLKYRVLALAWSKDGETRDDTRARYCQNFYDLVVIISQKFMSGINGRFRQGETVEPVLAMAKQ